MRLTIAALLLTTTSSAFAADLMDAALCEVDWCEIALDVCRHKKRTGQNLKNSAGLLVKILKDSAMRDKLVPPEEEKSAKDRFRQREAMFLRQKDEAEERALILEYEHYRERIAQQCFEEMSVIAGQALRKEKMEQLQREGRLEKIQTDIRDREITHLVLLDLAKKEAPPYAKWLLRRRAMQAVLPFSAVMESAVQPENAA